MAKSTRRLVICLDNSGYEVSLERRKIYVALPDAPAERLGQIRVVDESGDDYLYPAELFVAADLPAAVRRAVLQAACAPDVRAGVAVAAKAARKHRNALRQLAR